MTRLSDRREQRRLSVGLPCRGRPLDADLDTVIRGAALCLLAEVGYERMTMDAVAARAKVSKATIYRRWESKAHLVVEAMREARFDELELPVTGDFRADLFGVLAGFVGVANGPDRELFQGVVSAMRGDAELRHLVRERMLDPKRDRARSWVRGYVERGELPAHADVALVDDVGFAMIALRVLVTGEPVDDAFIAHITDDILLPLLTTPAYLQAAHLQAADLQPAHLQAAYRQAGSAERNHP